MSIIRSNINRLTFVYAIIALAACGILAPYIAKTGTEKESFFLILLNLDLTARLWTLIVKQFWGIRETSFKKIILGQLKKLFVPLINPFWGSHILFIPSWCVSLLFIAIIRKVDGFY